MLPKVFSKGAKNIFVIETKMKTDWLYLQDNSLVRWPQEVPSNAAPPAMLRPTMQLLENMPEFKESSRARNRRMREERRRRDLGLEPEPAIFPSSVYDRRFIKFRRLTTDEVDMGQTLCDHGYHYVHICKCIDQV